jgi:predicted RNA-binding protein with TRAM domain
MEVPVQLRCLFSAEIDEQNGGYRIEVPAGEIERDNLDEGEVYRVALLPSPSDQETTTASTQSTRDDGPPDPPVDEGETRTVEIEDIGDQGDGITRVERGFVVVVPDTDVGERVRIDITDVRETVAFATVAERVDYYE